MEDTEKYDGPFVWVEMRGGRGHFYRGEAREVARQAVDIAGPTFLELIDLHGEAVYVRARDIQCTAPAKAVPIDQVMAEIRGSAGRHPA